MTAALVAAFAVAVCVGLAAGVPPTGRPASPGVAAAWALGAAVAVVVLRWPVLLIAAAAITGAVVLWRRRTHRRLRRETAERVVEVCDLLASELAAGRPTVDALREAARTWPPLAPVLEAWTVGLPVPAALRGVAERPGAGGLALLAAGWQVAHEAGGGLADAASAVATDLRAARATGRVVDGELASARSTATLVACLPLVALVIGSGSGGDPWGFLLGTPAGLACLALGLSLELAGLLWIDRLAGAVGP